MIFKELSVLKDRTPNRLGGFTLLEILLSLAIFAVALPLLAVLFSGGAKQPATARERTQALFLAQELMEEIQTRKWDENATLPGKTSVPSTIGLDGGEVATDRSTYDDMDDYDDMPVDNPMHDAAGTTLASFLLFSSDVQVDYVGSDTSALDLETILGKSAGTDFKRTDVTVNWPDGTVTLSAVRGNY